MPAPATPPTSQPVSELELIDAVVTTIDDTLAAIDRVPGMSPAEQLARLAVGVVRACAPLIRAERDRMLAEAAPR